MTQENIDKKKEEKTQRKPRAPRKNIGATKNTKTTRKTRDIKETKETRKTKTSKDSIFKKGKLKIIPLGGLHEVGKNITVFEYEDEMIVVDCGLSFPEDDMLGIDLVIPDITYLQKNVDKIKGLIITHGHENHIRKCTIYIKTNKYSSICTKTSNGIN